MQARHSDGRCPRGPTRAAGRAEATRSTARVATFAARVSLLAIMAMSVSSCMLATQARSMVFPPTHLGPNHRDIELSASAALVPSLIDGYRDPAGAARCVRDLLQPPARPTDCLGPNWPQVPSFTPLWDFGRCLTRASTALACSDTAAARWCGCYVEHILPQLPGGGGYNPSNVICNDACPPAGAIDHLGDALRAIQPQLPASCAPLDDRDRTLVLLALADFGENLYAYQRSMYADLGVLNEPVACGALVSLYHALDLITHDPSARPNCPGGVCTHRAVHPVLALSGGAANGAFTAGYVHALLALRELAIATGAHANEIEDDERFGGATGTSVGALLAGLVDLYFSPRGVNAEPQRATFDWIVEQFTRNTEWRLLCVEPADVGGLAGQTVTGSRPVGNLMRFDPLRDNVTLPFFDRWGPTLLDNDFLRIVMTVDLVQNVTMGLDERACRAMPALSQRRQCFEAGVSSSLVEPVLAQRIDRVYSGLRGAVGEPGFWYDGGLRSGTPALRALLLTDGFAFRPSAPGGADPIHVLAISTNQSEGTPRNPLGLDNALSIVFGTLGSFADQTRMWELGYASQYAITRADRLRTLRHAPTAMGTGLGAIGSVFVPEHANAQLMTDGYTFDPLNMIGLFLLGERTMLTSAPRLLLGLGWQWVYNAVMQPGPGTSPSIWQAQLIDWGVRDAGYTQLRADSATMSAYAQDRRATYDRCMRYCGVPANTDSVCLLPVWNQRFDAFRPRNPL